METIYLYLHKKTCSYLSNVVVVVLKCCRPRVVCGKTHVFGHFNATFNKYTFIFLSSHESVNNFYMESIGVYKQILLLIT